jgi:hypothetical protein
MLAGARVSFLRYPVLSTIMEPFQENSFNQSSHPVPTIEEVNNWDAEELLEWIGENRPKLIKGDKLETFKAKDISGDVFLRHAGDVEFFEKKCNLPCGTSERLANLASEIVAKQAMGI